MPTVLGMKAGRTTAPELLKEEDLITVMNKEGIGTDATIAQHIKTILMRKYAEKIRNMYFAPTKLGRALVESYVAIGQPLAKPYLRANMEAACTAICRGEKTKEEVVKSTMAEMRIVFTKVMQSKRMLEMQVPAATLPRFAPPHIIRRADLARPPNHPPHSAPSDAAQSCPVYFPQCLTPLLPSLPPSRWVGTSKLST